MWSGIFYLLLAIFFIFCLCPGIVVVAIFFNKWYHIKQFKRGILATPVAIIVGILFWPRVIAVVRRERKKTKDRTVSVVMQDRATC